jgi:hypothetical protein
MESASRLLINEQPLQALPTLALLLGIDKAIILQQIQYWLSISPHEREGQKWIYNSYKEWAKQFPWMGIRKLRYLIPSLEQEGYLITGRFNKRRGDNTKWYRINYGKLEELLNTHVPKLATGVPNFATGVPNFATPLPEITTEITTENTKDKPINELLSQLQSLPYWKGEEIDVNWLAEFTGEFPEFAVQNLIECRDFWDGRRPRGKGDWKNRLRNWMKKGREFAAGRTAAQVEVERKRSSIPGAKKKPGSIPSRDQISEQVRRVTAGLPPE